MISRTVVLVGLAVIAGLSCEEPPREPAHASYDNGADHMRLDSYNTLEFLDFAEKKFGRSFVACTWLGFKPVKQFYAAPLDIEFEIGNGFSTTLPGSVSDDYMGTDLYCDDINQVELPVKAAADGEIDGLTLNIYLSVTIRHKGGVWTHYGHLGKIAPLLRSGPLRSGQPVKQGEVIGYILRNPNPAQPYRGKAYLYLGALRQDNGGIINPVDVMPILRPADYPAAP